MWEQTESNSLLIRQEEFNILIVISNTRFHFVYGSPWNGSALYISNSIIVHIVLAQRRWLRSTLPPFVIAQEGDVLHKTNPVVSL